MSAAFDELRGLAIGAGYTGNNDVVAIALNLDRLYMTNKKPTWWTLEERRQCDNIRDRAIAAVVHLDDDEWEEIREGLLNYDITTGEWHLLMKEWVCDLETLRAFG